MIESRTIPTPAGEVSFDVEYFRTYGIHTVSDHAGEVHILSFPDWEGLESVLEEGLPADGTVLTSELATFTGPHDELAANAETVENRIDYARKQTETADVELWLGTPTVPASEFHDWRNTVMTIRNGRVVAATHKILLSGYESKHSPIKAAPKKCERYASPLGRSAVICSDLIASSSRFFDGDPWPGTTLLASTCWAAVPDDKDLDAWRERTIEEDHQGSEDGYFKNALERVVAMAFIASAAQTIVVADRNVPGTNVGGPYNAVFRRVAA